MPGKNRFNYSAMMIKAHRNFDAPEITLKELSENIDKTAVDLQKSIETRDAEIKKNGEASEATGKKVDDIGKQYEEMSVEAKALVLQTDEMKKRMDEFEKSMGRPGMPSMNADALKSSGQQFTDSDAYKSMVASGKGNSDSVKVGSFFNRKADIGVVTLDAASAGKLPIPYRVPEIIIPPERSSKVRDLITVATAGTGTIEYTEETGFAPLFTELSADVTAGTNIMPVVSVAGCFVGQTIFVGLEEFVVGAIDDTEDAEKITLAGAYGVAIDYAKGTDIVSNVFAPTAEGRRKPQMNISYELKSLSAKTVASWIPVTKQALSDATQLQSLINTRLLYGLSLTEDYQLLYGDGIGQNLQGIMTNALAQSYAWSSGIVGDTRIDAIRRAMTLARLAEYPISGVVLHPTDWEYIELAKGSNERYIWVQVTTGGVMQLWRAPVVDTTAIAVGEFLTGAFQLGATLYDREMASIDVAEQHADFFIKNMVAVRAEERIALATFRPEAFVVGDFDSAPV